MGNISKEVGRNLLFAQHSTIHSLSQELFSCYSPVFFLSLIPEIEPRGFLLSYIPTSFLLKKFLRQGLTVTQVGLKLQILLPQPLE